MNKKVASSKNRNQFQLRVHIPYPISDQNGKKKIYNLFQTKMAQKPYPFGPQIPIWLI